MLVLLSNPKRILSLSYFINNSGREVGKSSLKFPSKHFVYPQLEKFKQHLYNWRETLRIWRRWLLTPRGPGKKRLGSFLQVQVQVQGHPGERTLHVHSGQQVCSLDSEGRLTQEMQSWAFIQPSIQLLYPRYPGIWGHGGVCWSLSQLSQGEDAVRPWTGRQFQTVWSPKTTMEPWPLTQPPWRRRRRWWLTHFHTFFHPLIETYNLVSF